MFCLLLFAPLQHMSLCVGSWKNNYQVLLANDVVFIALRAAHKPKAYLFPKVLY